MLLAAMSAVDKLSIGGITSLLGLGMTFIVLAILIGLIILLEKGLEYLEVVLNKRKERKKGLSAVSSQEVQVTEASGVIEEGVRTEVDANTIAAISRAVALFSQYDDKDKKPHNNIVIKSVTEIE